ncbi:hypothetical protein BO71DRAFT_468851 [Aspergillus ellipticus CBS 707.79]|uniref:Aminoglycoside phosphotransferase domain-containing protein n=1 Tax=Aspergillus ellipticus CBS 707.79 TaxID=1448320 RepID=A0A319DHY3_9EURO|nr:hypothetical protein BO71DRAFT_468851 [Aspergillus ellipticus CBS 707.79]
MASSNLEYSVAEEIDHFFEQTTTTRSACDKYAIDHLGDQVIPVAVQGVCSYTVYAGPNADFVVQFRLKSLQLKMDTADLAESIYGQFAPNVTFKGQIGGDVQGKEPLYIYVMSRIRGIGYLDFILAHSSHVPDNSPKFSLWRQNLVTDIAKFFALSWKAPQEVTSTYRDGLLHRYTKELRLLLASPPDRFRPLIQESLDLLPVIISLPTVLLHKDFGVCNIMVNETSCNLVGVVD